MGIGAALGISWVALRSSANERLFHVNACIGSLVGAMFGGRIAYIVVNWSYFRQHLLEAFQVYQGGLAWPGALAGGILMVTAWAIHSRKPTGELFWVIFPLLTSVVVFAWLACWWDGCAYGIQVNTKMGMLALDEAGNRSLRFPTQFAGALATLLWFIVLETQRERFLNSKISGWIGLLGLAIILFGLTYLRADPGVYAYGLRLDAWSAVGFAVLALIGVFASWR